MSQETAPKITKEEFSEAYVRAEAEDAVRDEAPLVGNDIYGKPARVDIHGNRSHINLDEERLGADSSRKWWKAKAEKAADDAAIEAGFKEAPVPRVFEPESDDGESDVDPEVMQAFNESQHVSVRGTRRSPDGQAIAEYGYNGDGIDKFHGRNQGTA